MTDSGGIISFESYRQKRDENSVRCAKCGKWIIPTATQCPECGIHFQGQAQDFDHPSERSSSAPRSFFFVAIVLFALAATIVGVFRFR